MNRFPRPHDEPAPLRVKDGAIVQWHGIACRVSCVMRGGQLVELRGLDGVYVGVARVADLSPAPVATR